MKGNLLNAWACKFTIEDKQKTSQRQGLLEGKTIILKDCISVAGVPCTIGTYVLYLITIRVDDSQIMISDAISPPWVPFVDATVVTRVLQAGGIVRRVSCFICHSKSSFSKHR